MSKAINIGNRRELFVDGEMFEKLGDTEFVLHQPEPREIAIRRDTLADDHATSYYSIIHNGEKYIMSVSYTHLDVYKRQWKRSMRFFTNRS